MWDQLLNWETWAQVVWTTLRDFNGCHCLLDYCFLPPMCWHLIMLASPLDQAMSGDFRSCSRAWISSLSSETEHLACLDCAIIPQCCVEGELISFYDLMNFKSWLIYDLRFDLEEFRSFLDWQVNIVFSYLYWIYIVWTLLNYYWTQVNTLFSSILSFFSSFQNIDYRFWDCYMVCVICYIWCQQKKLDLTF